MAKKFPPISASWRDSDKEVRPGRAWDKLASESAAMISLNERNIIGYLNFAAERLLGVSSIHAKGRNWSDVVHLLDSDDRVLSTPPAEITRTSSWWLERTHDGGRVRIQLSFATIETPEGGQQYNRVATLYEIATVYRRGERFRLPIDDGLNARIDRSVLRWRANRNAQCVDEVEKTGKRIDAGPNKAKTTVNIN